MQPAHGSAQPAAELPVPSKLAKLRQEAEGSCRDKLSALEISTMKTFNGKSLHYLKKYFDYDPVSVATYHLQMLRRAELFLNRYKAEFNAYWNGLEMRAARHDESFLQTWCNPKSLDPVYFQGPPFLRIEDSDGIETVLLLGQQSECEEETKNRIYFRLMSLVSSPLNVHANIPQMIAKLDVILDLARTKTLAIGAASGVPNRIVEESETTSRPNGPVSLRREDDDGEDSDGGAPLF